MSKSKEVGKSWRIFGVIGLFPLGIAVSAGVELFQIWDVPFLVSDPEKLIGSIGTYGVMALAAFYFAIRRGWGS